MASAERATVADDSRDDGALVLALAQRDREALASLYDRHAPTLLALGVRILGERAVAEEVLEEVFLDLWHGAGTIDPGRQTVRTWLLERMRVRALGRRLPDREVPDRPGPGPTVAGLSPELVAVIELAYFEGLSSAQIADRLRIPIAVVRARLALALQTLRHSRSAGAGET
jgi:RNA polymerase sigma-70 factor (ECF subfamily)